MVLFLGDIIVLGEKHKDTIKSKNELNIIYQNIDYQKSLYKKNSYEDDVPFYDFSKVELQKMNIKDLCFNELLNFKFLTIEEKVYLFDYQYQFNIFCEKIYENEIKKRFLFHNFKESYLKFRW